MEAIKAFFKTFILFDRREKRNSAVMFGLIVLGAILETVGVGIILPFVSIVLSPDIIKSNEYLKLIYDLPFVGNYKNFVVFICFAMILIFLLKSLYMFFLLYIQNRFTLNRQIVMAKRLFNSYMKKPYKFFFDKNAAELQRNVNVLVPAVINGLLMPGLCLMTEFLIVFFILIVLLMADPISAISISVILGVIGWIFYNRLKNTLSTLANIQNIFTVQMYKSVLEGIGSIKEIKIMERESNFINIYNESSKEYAKTQAFLNLANQSPRLLIESLSVCGIILIVLVNVLNDSDMNSILPVLALFAMAAIRMMPSMNRILGYITSMRFNAVHLDVIFNDVLDASRSTEQNFAENSEVNIREIKIKQLVKDIVIKDLTYRYPNTETNILEQVNITITKGQSIGIVGPSGAGKSTLVDIILGLLEPTEGQILVDGTDIQQDISAWRKNLGYVPQSIFLIDDTILNNVAFGISKSHIDEAKVWAALDAAQMKDFVEGLPNKINTVIGQNGMLLSGGQRQRIGIARALYHDPEILILDEATSSLDSEIEKLISDAITTIGKSKTMIIIAHRVNTLDKCDLIYKVDNKKVSCQSRHQV